MKKVIVILSILMMGLMLTGCDIQIFEDKNAKNLAKEYKKDELLVNTYYIKEGTSFYEAYKCSSNSSGTDLDLTRCCWLMEDEKKVPTYYEDGLIAKATSDKIEDKTVVMERYLDCGYSFGVYGCKYTDGYISFNLSQNTIKNTSLNKKLKDGKSQNILIETINGIPVTENMLNDAGIILGMEKDKEYSITYYAGSYYGEETIVADTHLFQCFECYKLNDYNMTQNGYISMTVPKDLKTGYYRLNGKGFFRYIADKKGAVDLATADYNDPYYESPEDQMAVFSQQYVFQIDRITSNMSVKADFDPETVMTTSGIVKMMLTSPEGKRMTVETDKESGTISCDMSESQAGQWTVNISPQSMSITNIEVVSNADEMEATKEELTLSLDHDMTGIIVKVPYEGEGMVSAQIIDPQTNESYTMVDNKSTDPTKEQALTYNFPYLAKGDYKVFVYHYPDTKIGELTYSLSENVKEVEIIEIEE